MMKSRPMVPILVLLICSTLATSDRAAVKPPPQVIDAGGLSMLVLFTRESAEILRAEPTLQGPPPGSLRPPVLVEGTARRFRQGTEEIVLAFLNAEGGTIESYGWSARSRSFVEAPRQRAEARPRAVQHGGLRPARPDQRLLHVPIREGAAYALFYRSSVERRPILRPPEGEFVIVRRILSLYDLTASGGSPSIPPRLDGFPGPLPPSHLFPCDRPFGPMFTPAPPFGSMFAPAHPSGEGDPPPPPPSLPPVCAVTGHGRVARITNPIYNGSPSCKFDIVILGDGFGELEQDLFEEEAKELAEQLLNDSQPPDTGAFEKFRSEINVHLVHTISESSGITNCPDPGNPKLTFYNVEGFFDDADSYGGNLGTRTPEIVEDVVACIAPPSQIEVKLILANCPLDAGGRAYENLKLSILPRITVDAIRVDLVAHELAHAAANLGEEYVSCCVPVDPPEIHTYRNIVTEAQRLERNVWWRELASPAELDSDGWFRAVQTYGAAMSPEWENLIGLFWGAQYVDITGCPPVSGDSPCNEEDDCDGRCCAAGCYPGWPDPYYCSPGECRESGGYFRPQAGCRMRSYDLGWGFCRVCNEVLSKAILAPSSMGFRRPFCGKSPCVIVQPPAPLCRGSNPGLYCPGWTHPLMIPKLE